MKQTINKMLKHIFPSHSWRGGGGEAFCLALSALTLVSCFSDDTTLGDRPLAEIVIDSTSVAEVYNINKNETLTVTPKFSQTNGGKTVTTTWEIDQKVYSNEPTLTFTGKELGSWNCRLILENEDGKTFYYAEDADGNGYLSEAVEKTSIGFMGEERVTLAAPDDAKVFDAMGPEDCDVQFIVNTLYVKTRLDKTVTLTADGREIEFSKEYATGQIGNWDGVTLLPGYVRTEGFSPNQQWAWSPYYGSGWSPELGVIPDGFPYVDGPFGSYARLYAPVASGPDAGGRGAGVPGH